MIAIFTHFEWLNIYIIIYFFFILICSILCTKTFLNSALICLYLNLDLIIYLILANDSENYFLTVHCFLDPKYYLENIVFVWGGSALR